MVYLKFFAFYTSYNVYPQTENRQANKWQAYERHLFALFALSKSTAVCIIRLFHSVAPNTTSFSFLENEFKSHAFHLK